MPDPRSQKLSAEKIQKLVDAGKTPRARELEMYQAFHEGKAYEGRPHFYDDEQPLHKRAPNIVYRLSAIAAESNAAFALGEGRFPSVLSLSSESDDVFDQALGLSANDSQTLDSFNGKLVDLAGLETAYVQAYKMAQASRSVAIVLGYRAGLPFADLIWAKLCVPSFDDPTDPYRCTRLEVRYRYTEPWRDELLTNGEWWTRVFEYLRVIDDKADTVYQPVPIWEETDAGAVEGQTAVKVSTAHGFGFCPVHWYARNRKSVVGTGIDGEAVHDGLCGMIEQLDMSLSQRHRGAVYAGDPQTVISGVSDDDPIGATGQKTTPTALPGDGGVGKQWQRAFGAATGPGGTALRRGVGQVWRIADPSGKAELLCLPADALDALDKDGKDLAQKLCDDMGVTIVDPSVFSGGGDLSGRTLAFIFSKQINRVSQDRRDLAKCLILPVLNLYYRMLLASSDGVYLPGLAKVMPILSRFYRTVGAGQKIWFCPQLKLKWGDYFEPSDVDESTRTATAISAYTANLVTLKAAVEHIRGVFQIGSVDQFVDELQAEVAQRQADAVTQAQAMATPPAGAPAKAGNPAATQSPNAAPPASSAPKAKRNAKPAKASN